jgi:hypothetical protein
MKQNVAKDELGTALQIGDYVCFYTFGNAYEIKRIHKDGMYVDLKNKRNSKEGHAQTCNLRKMEPEELI